MRLVWPQSSFVKQCDLQGVGSRTKLSDTQVLAFEIGKRVDLARLFGRHNFGFTRRNTQLHYRFYILSRRLQIDGVVVGPRAGIHLARQHLGLS